MFYIVENNVCLYITPTMKDANNWLKINNKTIYKVCNINNNKVVEFTNVEMAYKYAKDHSYEIYTVYCGGYDIVIIEVK